MRQTDPAESPEPRHPCANLGLSREMEMFAMTVMGLT